MFKNVFFEISGKCNAMCPYCITGKVNRIGGSTNATFVEIEKFKKIIEKLQNIKIVDDKTVFHLYNWGEPFLHPELNNILQFLCEKKIFFSISTNASIIPVVDPKVFEYLVSLRVSMSGFSKKTYEKIHGFCFEKILKNIDQIVEMIRFKNVRKCVEMCFHLYQFNVEEIGMAEKFCNSRNIKFTPIYAYLAEINQCKSYLDNTLTGKELRQISKDIFLFYVDDLINNMPHNYRCPQYNCLTINENGTLNTCCVMPRDHPSFSLGSVLDLSKEEIINLKTTQTYCEGCIKKGMAYWLNNPRRFPV